MTARGIRNCNPLNIKKKAGTTWKGQTADQPDPIFVTFATVPFGFRAAAIILDGYQRNHGLWTVDGIIRRWSETDQAPYVANVSAALGVAPTDHVALRHGNTLRTMMRAMCVQENGDCPYPDRVLDQGIALAMADRP